VRITESSGNVFADHGLANLEFLTALGQDVEITLRPARKQHGEISVTLG
jgi:hypothetical protein